MNAQEVAIEACQRAKPFLTPGITEKAFAEICEQQMLALGAEGLWYPMLVNFNTNSIYCTRGGHLPSEDVILQPADIVLIDFSPMVQGLWGDYSETIVIGDAPDFHRLADAAKRIFEQTYRYAAACRTIGELFDYAHDLIVKDGYELLDPNGNIGHSITNYNNQDQRIYLCPENRDIELAGQKWAIEPHIGMGGYGAKFENVIDRSI
ncbi:Methionine aminopeptidase 1, mitochondrial [Paenibacillus plantiphilus]|uniref:Methionine aminopeptidase 1, mitochondrial n=1 Tax=Paenibacillus plantiphilus TaxID=2905650 RepID=A0ABN8GRS5_9BACL|nr:M24 family metallopeptidase [Paenibacillus plantiphilus]CAH1215224.1 Methionine aminopeptidase 1, mitochondrial [Paenibacillus plantiphilus]